MKKGFLILCILLCCRNIYAQQNLFNIPSGDFTPKGKIFFQQQINAYALGQYEIKSHFVLGLSDHLELGLNVVNTPMRFQRNVSLFKVQENSRLTPLYPVALFTAQFKLFKNEHWQGSLGTQTGSNLFSEAKDMRLCYFHYALLSWEPIKKLRVIAGPYYGNRYLLGKEKLGFVAGAEFILHKKLYLIGDMISGNHQASNTVLGINYLAFPKVQFCLGALLPLPNTQLKKGLVFEINILGYKPHVH